MTKKKMADSGPVQKDRSMEMQKQMIADHFQRLEAAPETGEPVVYTFVPGNLTELIRSFDALPVLPEINALQSGMRGKSRDYIAEAERIFLEDLMTSEDSVEGIEAFYAKRRPEWKNA